MNPNTKKIIDDQIALLPEKVREVVKATNIAKEIEHLREKYSLMLDQISSLELETMLVMIGLEPTEDFVENIQKNVGIKDVEKATDIAEDINTLIFDKIRQVMMEENEETPEKKEEVLSKDSILAEIEDPTPTFQPKTSSTPVNVEKIPENFPAIKVSQALENYIPPSLPVKSIVEQKLSEPTRIPPQQIEVSLKKLPEINSQTISSPQKYTSDPYKEPIA